MGIFGRFQRLVSKCFYDNSKDTRGETGMILERHQEDSGNFRCVSEGLSGSKRISGFINIPRIVKSFQAI